MPQSFFQAQTTSAQRVSNGQQRIAEGTKDGAAYGADYWLKLALEGRLFLASVGTATTPITFKVGFTAAQPELAIDVPTATAIIPLYILVQLETSAGTINEVVVQSSEAAVGAGTSTVITPRATRTDNQVATGCTVYSAYSGAGATPTNTREFYRSGYAFADTTVGPLKVFEWNARSGAPQVIVGPGSLVVYVGGTSTAPTGFIKCVWAELPTTGI